MKPVKQGDGSGVSKESFETPEPSPCFTFFPRDQALSTPSFMDFTKS